LNIQVSQGSAATDLRLGVRFYSSLQKWKNYLNRSTIAEAVTKDLRGCFLTHHVDNTVAVIGGYYRRNSLKYKKAVLSQGNRAMPQLFFSV